MGLVIDEDHDESDNEGDYSLETEHTNTESAQRKTPQMEHVYV